VTVGPNDEIAFTGFFQSAIDFGEGAHFSRGMADAFIARYASDGGFRWSRTFGGSFWDTAAGIRFDRAGTLYANGWFEAPLDFGKGMERTSGMYLMELAP
jgi:hypothetical protein